MSDHENRLNESLSALMDSEANDIEIRRILKELDANDSADKDSFNRFSCSLI